MPSVNRAMSALNPIQGFVPVLTFRYRIDELLIPYVEQLCPAALFSLPELRHRHGRAFPRVPLLIDSGGYAALNAQNRVEEEDGLGVLVFADGTRLSPQDVHVAQCELAAVGFTLDFPCPKDTDEQERARRNRLSEANALWALAQPRNFLLYACVQPGQSAEVYLGAGASGLALGGLAPFSADRAFLTEQVREARAILPDGLPLHVLGIGHPESVRAVLAAGATSVDSSSVQRHAASGKTWTGESLPDASVPEQLRLALSNLLTVQHASVPLYLHPLWGVR